MITKLRGKGLVIKFLSKKDYVNHIIQSYFQKYNSIWNKQIGSASVKYQTFPCKKLKHKGFGKVQYLGEIKDFFIKKILYLQIHIACKTHCAKSTSSIRQLYRTFKKSNRCKTFPVKTSFGIIVIRSVLSIFCLFREVTLLKNT